MTFPTRTVAPQILAPRRALLGAALAAAALLTAPAVFAQSKSDQSDSAAGGGKDYTVMMSNMAFGAIPSGLKVGDTITWVNNDTVIHSVTARDHSFDLRINPRQSMKLTLMNAGTIPIYCLFHPNMRASITVAAR